jgi:hypothetical protein
MATLAEVVTRHGPSYLDRYGPAMPEWHRRALVRLMACRTYEAGRVYYQCGECGDWQMTAAACGHRACAQCGHHRAVAWEARQRERLLPVPYHMVTFTVPSELRSFFKGHQIICYHLLMTQSAATLQEIARDPRHLGGEIGCTGVLHTWKRDLGYHPHVHYIMPSGAAGATGWIRPKHPSYLLPSAVLAVRMRNRFRETLRREHPDLFAQVPTGAWQKPWNVNVQAVGQGEKAFGYLARYVQSTAIRNKRIIACDDQTVTYEWVDRQSGQVRHEKVTGHEFLRRFLQHALPKGLMRVRHCGFLSAAAKKRFAQVRTWLGVGPPSADQPAEPAPPAPPAPPAAGGGASTELPPEPSRPPISPAATSVPLAAVPLVPPVLPVPGRICCAKCQQEMRFIEHRSAHHPGDPAGLRPSKRQLPKPPAESSHRRVGLPVLGPESTKTNQSPRGPPRRPPLIIIKPSHGSHAPA